MSFLLEHLKSVYPDISTAHIFSDGTSAQFKNCSIFSVLPLLQSKFDINVHWHYSITSHAKGVVDGIGGTIERIVWNYAIANNAEIVFSSAENLAVIATLRNPNIMIKYLSSNDAQEKAHEVQHVWESAIPVSNTHNGHYVTPAGSNQFVLVGETSDDTTKRKERVVPSLDSDSEMSEPEVCEDFSTPITSIGLKGTGYRARKCLCRVLALTSLRGHACM